MSEQELNRDFPGRLFDGNAWHKARVVVHPDSLDNQGRSNYRFQMQDAVEASVTCESGRLDEFVTSVLLSKRNGQRLVPVGHVVMVFADNTDQDEDDENA